ncbi:uncharacterized protein EAF01_011803 [Botrytis porri]|uniref:Uncharacterized protein n=1 Tax=Botrytis porri TaxID=87229 RepID=A0A4Z1L083_9HELO|nr:uncharacterized protein EAF01_011803 [Botrytis porri]KAF7882023.1 hypothetical protein EAF01_011803 [Botrytis porri]TGO90188.1 hypothetical protein BPOR_0075g00180 [Botrytis porri]
MNLSSPIEAPSERSHSPAEVKHMIFVSLLKEGRGAPKGIPSMTLTNLSMYDPKPAFIFATSMSLGEDESLQSIVEKAAIDNAKCDKLREDIRWYLKHPDAENIRQSVETLLDDDIMARGLLRKDPGILKRAILAKAFLIVEDFERERLDIEAEDESHDFAIQLVTLINGWAEVSQVNLFYFKYKTSFEKFERTLKDETQNSKIPPENIVLPALSWPSVSSEAEEFSMCNQNSENTSGTQNTNWDDILTENPESIQNLSATVERDQADKGFNLADGPWMYRLPHTGKDPAKKPGWRPIRDKDDYMVMLDSIRRVNFKYAEWGQSTKCSVMIMHSLDRDCQQRYFDRREEERAYSAEWEKELEKAGFFDDEKNAVGEYGDDWIENWNTINKPLQNLTRRTKA